MLIEDRTFQKRVTRLVYRFVTDPEVRKDLMQELLLHLWLLELECPGQTQSWYLQSCRFHSQNFLDRGTSIDSMKRRHARCPLPGASDLEYGADGPEDEIGCDDSLLSIVSARDIAALLTHCLTGRAKLLISDFADGLTIAEIAKNRRVSHQAISKHRNQIESVARNLGILPPPR